MSPSPPVEIATPSAAYLASLRAQLRDKSEAASLSALSHAYPGKVVFSTSFGLEDQAIAHLIAHHAIDINIFTLDTGRLFPETYNVWSRTLETYRLPIRTWYPEERAIGTFVDANGPNAFYGSTDLRKECCGIRKVAPLRKALGGYAVWITGLRTEQSANRNGMESLEWDEGNRILKFHPLLHWTWADLQAYIHTHAIPHNVLHDRGFVSIGCAPCTRAIQPGEDFRAGRWWWEDESKKECGLHGEKVRR